MKKIMLALIVAMILFMGGKADAGATIAYSYEFAYGQFGDVKDSDWFARVVVDACNYGFFKGKSETAFDPGGLLTLGEAVKLAARFNSISLTGKADFAETVPFYDVYVEYALAHGIIENRGDFGAPIKRSQFAVMIHDAMPPGALPAINEIPKYGIYDVVPGSDYYDAVHDLYCAGIFAGVDGYGTFSPDSTVTRAEACAIMVRLADKASRIAAAPPSSISAEAIYQRSVPAVFSLETFDFDGNTIRTGTGFFISSSGLAVTALHVTQGATLTIATLNNGDAYAVLKTVATSEEYNLIIFSLNVGERGAQYLPLADSDLSVVGSTVYALGNPLALVNTISEGIVSNAARDVADVAYFQFSAPISFGSGGSPILNTLGQVVGIASSTYSYGQNLNLAIPVNFVREMLEEDQLLQAAA